MSASVGSAAEGTRAPPARRDLMTAPAAFGRQWYEREPQTLAMALLGRLVVREVAGTVRVGRIVETEAYAGTADRASHARAGRTRRTGPMFGPAGHAYVYLVYGMHHCLNVVAETEQRPAAVLIRALEPVVGLAAMRHGRRGADVADERLLAGPALACAGLAIDREFDGHDLTTGRSLWIGEDPTPGPRPRSILRGPRVGVEYAGPGWADRPWRFGLAGSPSLSRPFPVPVRTTRPTV